MISYTHKVHPLARSLKLKIEPNGDVVVVTPKYVPQRMVQDFVTSHLDWITQTQAKLKKIKPKVSSTDLEIFGQSYPLVVTQDQAYALGVTLKQNQIFIRPPSRTVTLNPSSPKIKQEIDRYLKATAEKYIIPRTHQLGEIMGISFKHITLREQKSRWGSCSSQGNLNFNWRLVHYPPAIIDYVIIHELAHRKHMDHGLGFWNLVRQYDPDFLKHRGWLKRHGLNLG